MLSEPVTVISYWVKQGYQRVFVDSGFISWLNAARQMNGQGSAIEMMNRAGSWLMMVLWDYLQATVYVTVIFAIRGAILVLSVPLFIMVSVIGTVHAVSGMAYSGMAKSVVAAFSDPARCRAVGRTWGI